MPGRAKKLFGTDGIRGAANAEPMSVDTILRVGRAAACVFRRQNQRRHTVIIGKDTRLSGYMFETALASGLCSMGVDVILVGPIPTPGIAFLTADMRVDAGVVISASHNPYYDNGIKFFGPDGFKLADAREEAIERWVRSGAGLDRRRPNAQEIGKATRLEDARGRYISYLKHNFPKDLSLDGLRIALDCAHGASYKIAPAVLEELGARVTLICAKPDGRNINEKCGAVHPQKLIRKVGEAGCDVGIALDGDADRLFLCDEKGSEFDGDQVLAILAKAMQASAEPLGGVVGTVMSNLGLEKMLKGSNLRFYRAAVGDRYVVELMRARNVRLGGEPSGHVICLNRSTTGDGLLTALLVLAELRRADRPLSSFASIFERFPQVQRSVPVRERRPLEKIPAVARAVRAAQSRLKKNGRVVVRYSGTEAKARVMVEGEKETAVRILADEIASAIESAIGGG